MCVVCVSCRVSPLSRSALCSLRVILLFSSTRLCPLMSVCSEIKALFCSLLSALLPEILCSALCSALCFLFCSLLSAFCLCSIKFKRGVRVIRGLRYPFLRPTSLLCCMVDCFLWDEKNFWILAKQLSARPIKVTVYFVVKLRSV